MNLLRWNDDRLDDMHFALNDTRALVNANSKLVDAHDEAIKRLAVTGDRRSDRRYQFLLVLAAWVPAIVTITLALTGALR